MHLKRETNIGRVANVGFTSAAVPGSIPGLLPFFGW